MRKVDLNIVGAGYRMGTHWSAVAHRLVRCTLPWLTVEFFYCIVRSSLSWDKCRIALQLFLFPISLPCTHTCRWISSGEISRPSTIPSNFCFGDDSTCNYLQSWMWLYFPDWGKAEKLEQPSGLSHYQYFVALPSAPIFPFYSMQKTLHLELLTRLTWCQICF